MAKGSTKGEAKGMKVKRARGKGCKQDESTPQKKR